MQQKLTGTFYIVGVGPGDPELITVKACRVLEHCPVIAAPETAGHSAGGNQLALSIARKAVDLSEKEILLLQFPMVRQERQRTENIIAQAGRIESFLAKGLDVAMVNLGDVSIYSTAFYVMERICQNGYETIMIPGVPSFCAVAAQLGISLTEMNQPLHLIPASGMDLDQALELPGTRVLMKSGSRMQHTVEKLREHGLLDQASMVADCGLSSQMVCTDLSELPETVSYFATVVVKDL